MNILLKDKVKQLNMFFNGSLPYKTVFNRPSTGICFNASGVLENMAIDAPRFDCDPVSSAPLGLLIEPQRTNLITYSQQLSQWTNNGADSVTDNVYESPNGTNDATQIVTSSDSKGRLRWVNVAASTYYIASGYLKGFSGGSTYSISIEKTNTIRCYVRINTSTGTIYDYHPNSLARGAVLRADGWIYWWNLIQTGVSDSLLPFIVYADTASTFSSWGNQLEAVSSLNDRVSSYIKTTSSSATRAADQLSFSIPNGMTSLRYIFDDGSRQDVAVSAGAYTVPTNLNRSHIKRIITP